MEFSSSSLEQALEVLGQRLQDAQQCYEIVVIEGPHSKHFADLKRLNPSHEELLTAKNWCITHDVSEVFADELGKAVQALGDVDEGA